MNIIIVNGETKERREAEIVNNITAIRLIWIPGIRPVIVPAKIPINKKSISWNNILGERFNN